MAGITLAQLAKQETEPLRKGIIRTLLRDSQIMEYLPWVNISSLRVMGLKWKSLPTSGGWRKLNEGYSSGVGETEQVWEALYGFGTDIVFDRVLDKITNVLEPVRVTQTMMHLKALALGWNDAFINGDHASDEDQIEGLKKRVSLMPARQSVYFAGSGSAALDPTASVANARAFIDKWEEMTYKCNRGAVSAYFMNEGMYWGFGKVLRYAGVSGGPLMDITKDSWEREIFTYKGAPFIDMGLKIDQATEIITDSETAGDSGTDATSIYAASFGMDEGLTGIQLEELRPYDPLNGGEQESTPTQLLRIDWWNGLQSFGSYGIVRGRNVEGASNWT